MIAQAVAVFAIVMGLAIAGVWTKDILRNPEIDLSKGLFAARDKDSGALFWLHWLAEYSTAGALVAGGVGLLVGETWARPIALLALGALVYTSINSMGWAFSRRDRYAYAAPMLVGAVGGSASAVLLLVMGG